MMVVLGCWVLMVLVILGKVGPGLASSGVFGLLLG